MFESRPLAATLPEWAEWDKMAAKKWPVQYFLVYTICGGIDTWLYIQKRRLSDIKWAFVYRFVRKHQYHRLETGLPPRYYEYNDRIIEAILHTNKQFIDNDHCPPEDGPFREVYNWYTIERPSLEANHAAEEQIQDQMTPASISGKMSEFWSWLDSPESKPYKDQRKKIQKLEMEIRKKNIKYAKMIMNNIENMWN